MDSEEHNLETFGQRISFLRTRSSLTQEHVARSLGISRASLSHYENDRRAPDLSLIRVFADYYNVRTDYLLGQIDEPESFADNRKTIRVPDTTLEMTPSRELFLHWAEHSFGQNFWEDFVRMPDSYKYKFFLRCWQAWLDEKGNSLM